MTQEAKIIDRLAEKITARRMQGPAIFALEMYKPLAGLFYNLTLAAYPFLHAVLGLENFKEGAEVLKSPEAIEKLILILEAE